MSIYKNRNKVLGVLCALLLGSAVVNAQGVYKELVPGFSFTKSKVSIRNVSSPTVANLDFTAYHNSPLRYKPATPKFTPPEKKVSLNDLLFDGALESVKEKLSQCPLTKKEKMQPLAWGALKNRVYEAVHNESLAKKLNAVEAYKWNDKSVFHAYQEVTVVYLHHGKNGAEFWVCLEMAPWATFLPGADDDKNGIREVYAKVVGLPEKEAKEMADWISNDYTAKKLSYEGIVEWSQVLASYWYPTLNTDLSPVNAGESWPLENATMEKEILSETKSVKVKDPQVVIRGNPLGKVIYQVIAIPSVKRPAEDTQKASGNKDQNKQADKRLPENYTHNMEKIAAELEAHGGTWEAWQKTVEPFHSAQKEYLKTLPAEQMGFIGQKNWLFFRKSMDYILAGDLSVQKPEYNAIEHLIPFNSWLEENEINMLFVPIPSKEEVYPEYLNTGKGKKSAIPADGIINPWGRKFIVDAQEEGFEVIDLLPAFLEAKKDDAKHSEMLFQKDDTHWTLRGMLIAAEVIAKRIEQYSWVGEVKPKKDAYSVVDTTFERLGDIVERLPVGKQSLFKPTKLEGKMVLLNGEKRRGSKDAPIILMGDSFTGVYELVDCKNGGVGSQISRLTGIETDIITSWGGGPNVRQKVYKARKDHLGPKRLVIYMMTARDLYQYSQTWKPLVIE